MYAGLFCQLDSCVSVVMSRSERATFAVPYFRHGWPKTPPVQTRCLPRDVMGVHLAVNVHG